MTKTPKLTNAVRDDHFLPATINGLWRLALSTRNAGPGCQVAAAGLLPNHLLDVAYGYFFAMLLDGELDDWPPPWGLDAIADLTRVLVPWALLGRSEPLPPAVAVRAWRALRSRQSNLAKRLTNLDLTPLSYAESTYCSVIGTVEGMERAGPGFGGLDPKEVRQIAANSCARLLFVELTLAYADLGPVPPRIAS